MGVGSMLESSGRRADRRVTTLQTRPLCFSPEKNARGCQVVSSIIYCRVRSGLCDERPSPYAFSFGLVFSPLAPCAGTGRSSTSSSRSPSQTCRGRHRGGHCRQGQTGMRSGRTEDGRGCAATMAVHANGSAALPIGLLGVVPQFASAQRRVASRRAEVRSQIAEQSTGWVGVGSEADRWHLQRL